MKKTNGKKKALVLSLAMAALLALPTTTFAQRESMGGLFGTQSENVSRESKAMLNQQGNRDGAEQIGVNAPGINNGQFGETAPLGSGIAILLLAGAGYVALKKKED